MNVYISVDMEGCSGIVHREQTNPKGYDYERARLLMTEEANAAVRGAFEAGAESVVVSDSHGGNGMRTLLVDHLDERVDIVTGAPRRAFQLEGLDDTFDALVMVGYHTRHGRSGVLSHTTNGRAVANLWVNGQVHGEVGWNALLAGHYGVPTVLVTGDDRTCAESEATIPGCRTVTVKWAAGRYAARCLHPVRARSAIRSGTEHALRERREIPPYTTTSPVTVRLQYKESGSAESAARGLGIDLVDADTIEFTCDDVPSAYEAYHACVDAWIPAWGDWIGGR